MKILNNNLSIQEKSKRSRLHYFQVKDNNEVVVTSLHLLGKTQKKVGSIIKKLDNGCLSFKTNNAVPKLIKNNQDTQTRSKRWAVQVNVRRLPKKAYVGHLGRTIEGRMVQHEISYKLQRT